MYKDNVPGVKFLIIRDLFSMLTNNRTPCIELHQHKMISLLLENISITGQYPYLYSQLLT
jgi:hypothetical protein